MERWLWIAALLGALGCAGQPRATVRAPEDRSLEARLGGPQALVAIAAAWSAEIGARTGQPPDALQPSTQRWISCATYTSPPAERSAAQPAGEVGAQMQAHPTAAFGVDSPPGGEWLIGEWLDGGALRGDLARALFRLRITAPEQEELLRRLAAGCWSRNPNQ